MNIEVTSVARKSQRLSRSAAAVSVITQEEIRRSGLTSVPELLRLVPGVQVARIDASRWAISARGFNGEYSNKLLVLLDGRSAYTEIFSGVYWDMHDTVIEDIERIEVIRGPGATMWGSNAVNGVINVITKSARDTQGSLLSLAAGNEERPVAAYRYGGRAGEATWYRFYTRFVDRVTPIPYHADPAAWRALRFGFRLDSELSPRDHLTVQTMFHKGDNRSYRGDPSPSPSGKLPDSSDTDNLDGLLLARWSRRLRTGEITLQAYFDQANVDNFWRWESVRTVDFEFQHRLRLNSRHELNWGLGIRQISDHLEKNQVASLDPARLTQRKYSAFLQDEWSLVPETLVLTLGSKFEHNYFTGLEVQPSIRLLWAPSPQRSLWAAVSRAERTPSRVDRGMWIALGPLPSSYGVPGMFVGMGSADFVSEDLTAFELGHRYQPTSRLSFDGSLFWNRYTHLAGYTPGTPVVSYVDSRPFVEIPVIRCNSGSGNSRGLEISSRFTATDRWKISASYDWLRISLKDSNRVALGEHNWVSGNSPAYQFQVRSRWDLSRRWTFDTALYYTGGIGPLKIPSHTRLDARLAWQPADAFEISLNGQNLVKRDHREFIAEGAAEAYPIRRSAYLKLTWWF